VSIVDDKYYGDVVGYFYFLQSFLYRALLTSLTVTITI